MHKIIRIDVEVQLQPVVVEGTATWQAKSDKLDLQAFGQSPDEAAKNFREAMLSGNVARKVDYEKQVKAKTPEAPEQRPDVSEEVEAPVEEEAGEVDLESLGKKELQSLAAERGIDTKGLLKKDLLNALAGGTEDDTVIESVEEDA